MVQLILTFEFCLKVLRIFMDFSDVDWSKFLDTDVPHLDCMFLTSNCVSWNAKKQPTVALPNPKAEFQSMAIVAFEFTWINSLLRDVIFVYILLSI